LYGKILILNRKTFLIDGMREWKNMQDLLHSARIGEMCEILSTTRGA